ncbi:hypothetical protein BGZ63DRAFT_393041 [Mariannaea sp. PMI_226]|nr:hypothetical protein BGZ63DRAFT_393041 [Mariannaea sp. PMI_226]
MAGWPLYPLIEDWLGSVIPDFEAIHPFDKSTQYSTLTKPATPRLMTTPPPSYRGGRNKRRDTSPTKRQRIDPRDDDSSEETGWAEELDNETPRSNAAPLQNPMLPPIPFRGFNAPSLTPSESPSLVSGSSISNQSPSVGGSERSRARGRRTNSKSPVKSSNSLWALELPAVYIPMGDNAAEILPGDVAHLFNIIEEISEDHVNIFPSEIRKDVEAIIPRAARKKEWFRNDKQRPATSHQDEACYPRSRKPKSPDEIALHELDLLREIGDTAKNCEVRGRAEVAWNMLVHQPLLQHALARNPTVQVEPSHTAKIMAPFSPATGGRGGGNVIENKMIDFSLTLFLNDGKPRKLDGDADDSAASADARLMCAIADRVWSQPSDAQSVNQTSYPPLQFTPIACNIETKTSAPQQTGQLQLSVWTAAWYQRIAMLVPERVSRYGIITLPLLHVVGHDWRLSFACWRRDRIEVVGELALGDTRTLLGTYTIVSVLRRIGDWIATDYRQWVEKMFLPEAEP